MLKTVKLNTTTNLSSSIKGKFVTGADFTFADNNNHKLVANVDFSNGDVEFKEIRDGVVISTDNYNGSRYTTGEFMKLDEKVQSFARGYTDGLLRWFDTNEANTNKIYNLAYFKGLFQKSENIHSLFKENARYP